MAIQQAIKYFNFWDVPRTFAFEEGGKVYVLTSEFDDDLDEYPDDYEVFVVSGIGDLSAAVQLGVSRLPKTSLRWRSER